ncbi:hypothetical protein ONZ51_g11746 [Trametes cubensis]|uniref:RecA family profile 1 domain-containing protein n=1 Tax=Trametes cubensis TaxID=1111947 RepID=A0AAD7X571_9APHY|nr:hypothetical protein ONZ51_g11746 [Trametes cubensis]
MESKFLSDLGNLTMAQKTTLARGKLQTVSDLLLMKPADAAKKCRIPVKEIEILIDLVCKELAPQPQTLRDVADLGEEKFTTGDSHIDDVLGGGVRTGMLWEISGENNAGKTQLALQLSLMVQLPQRLGGLSGAACYISTREDLVTPRLQEMIEFHPLLSPELCGLPEIHTVKAPVFVALSKVLAESVPAIADERARTPGANPVKLIVIDTFTDVFDRIKDPRYDDIFLRTRDVKQVSMLLHRLASKYQLAVVLLGGTRCTFPRIDGDDRSPGELRYSDQSRWFARAHTLAGEDAHEAILGHHWPKQLNARVMMSRTIRTRPRSTVHPRAREVQEGRDTKRRRLNDDQQRAVTPAADEPVPFRRFSVIFSSIAPPAFCDYVIFDEGVIGIPPEEHPPSTFLYPTPPSTHSPPSSSAPSSSTPRSSRPISAWSQSTSPSRGSEQPSQYLQSLSYAGDTPRQSSLNSVPPSQPTGSPSSQASSRTQGILRSPLPSYSSNTQSLPAPVPQSQSIVHTSQASSDGPQPTPLPSFSTASSISTRSLPTPVPLSQSIVPSSQPDLDEDWEMYWKDANGDEMLMAQIDDQLGGEESMEAAEAGPPVEKDTDSDYYWDDDTGDDALYADL